MLVSFYREWYTVRPESLTENAALVKKVAHATPIQTIMISVIFMLVSIFAGAFFTGQARGEMFRYLRPVGAYLIMDFAVMLIAALNAVFINLHILEWFEHIMRAAICGCFALLGFELIVNFIIEFYRPRSIEESRPIFESKLLSIFTEPGGVMRNIADTLDYQFRFKVSGTWIYSFIEKALFPLLIIWALILWGFTSIHLVKIGEVGVREEFGKVLSKELLEPGIYFSKPWPFGTIRCFSCMQLKQIFVGEDPTAHEHEEEEEEEDDGHGHSHGETKKPKRPKGPMYIINWTESHSHNDDEGNYFLIANKSGKSANSGNAAVDMVAFSMPVQYRIRREGIFDYAYLNSNPEQSIKRISQEETVKYLASATLNYVMATGRKDLENTIKQRIQKRVDAERLGVEIVNVNLAGLHPPVQNNTSKAFHEAQIAKEQSLSAVLAAEVYRDKLIPEAEINSLRIKSEAQSYEMSMKKVASAESERFLTHLKSYQIMPDMYKLRTYLEFLENDCKDIRKFIMSSSLKNEVYELNFEEKGALDLIDVDLDALSNK
jgi:regulator of protease activity HflC (stomatin/prohibitin superfamily)